MLTQHKIAKNYYSQFFSTNRITFNQTQSGPTIPETSTGLATLHTVLPIQRPTENCLLKNRFSLMFVTTTVQTNKKCIK
jgi:hypothetical protein